MNFSKKLTAERFVTGCSIVGIMAAIIMVATGWVEIPVFNIEPETVTACELTTDIDVESEVETETETETTTVVKDIYLGKFKLTAYCACAKCCEQYASNRPLDEYGNPIVYTASGNIARQGVTVAADTNILPFGTEIVIDGHKYIVHDRGGNVNGNAIDIYFESHAEANAFGVQYKEVYMKG